MQRNLASRSLCSPMTFLCGGSVALAAVLASVLLCAEPTWGSEKNLAAKSHAPTEAERGYQLLTHKAYVRPLFTDAMFDQLWTVWDLESRLKAAKLNPQQRRQMAFERYGLTLRPGQTDGMPLQYTDDGRQGWAINCFACHSGKVAGEVIAGVPNSLYAMQTLREEVRAYKFAQGTYTAKDVAATMFPLGGSNGTTNAVMFGVALSALRDQDFNLREPEAIPRLVHHDMDAPPFWNVKKKTRLYIDAFAPSDHRALMQFAMIPENSGERLRSWEDDFRAIYAWILECESPQYRWPINQQLAGTGRKIFNQNCAQCHGTYGDQQAGEKDTYPNRVVPIDEIGTDRVRFDALTRDHKQSYANAWIAREAQIPVEVDSPGYIAPPLDGVWASAPYFHNGSVPTLWHVLHPESRPTVWKRSIDGYDTQRVGLEVESLEAIPASVRDGHERRKFFDTQRFSKSAAGHEFPNALNEDEKQAVLEYLKTL